MSVTTEARVRGAGGPALPAWPVAVPVLGLPLWWVGGVLDVVWIPFAVVMAARLLQSRRALAPPPFGLWLLFCAWTAASAIMIDGPGDLLVFGYRLLLYLAGGVLFLYVYNARDLLRAPRVCALLTTWWVWTVAGGYLGLLLPELVVHTPMATLLPPGLLQNELVHQMVVRRTSQYNPDSYLQVAPRPSAPYLYTNNWGGAYSLLMPFVVARLVQLRRGVRFRLLLVLVPVSAVPAFLTLNRGMFLGLALAVTYGAVRALLLGRLRLVLGLLVAAGVGVALFFWLPVEERQDTRLGADSSSTSTGTRASLYEEALGLVARSPIFGHGGPQPASDPTSAPVGTQGQVWMLLVSHGLVATGCFVLWFVIVFVIVARRRDIVGLACSATLLVAVVELFYYGVLPYGLPLMMTAAALGMRGVDPPPTTDAARAASSMKENA